MKTPMTDAKSLWSAASASRGPSLRESFQFLLFLLAILWAIEALDRIAFGYSLDRLGIRPRTLGGLAGIVLSPFLHHGFGHLAANSIPFLVLGSLALARGIREFLIASAMAILVGGLGVWALGGANTIHVGASGLIFGYFGFLMAMAWFERSLSAVATAALVFFLYGGLLWGLRPFQAHVSWLGHLFGLAGGAWAARICARRH